MNDDDLVTQLPSPRDWEILKGRAVIFTMTAWHHAMNLGEAQGILVEVREEEADRGGHHPVQGEISDALSAPSPSAAVSPGYQDSSLSLVL